MQYAEPVTDLPSVILGNTSSSAQVPLTKGFFATVDTEDCQRVMNAGPWCAIVQKHTVYAKTCIAGKTVYLHRFIMNVTASNTHVDHHDRNGLNCQKYNLRPCKHSQNHMNERKHDGTTSQFKGVSWDTEYQKWRARIDVEGKQKQLGRFHLEFDAALAYDAAAREYFGEFALCNFPPKKPCVNSAPAYTLEPEKLLKVSA